MQSFRTLLAIVAGLAGLSAPALAQPAAADERPALWNGFYAGAHLGYGWVNGDPFTLEGPVAGVHVGYDRQYQRLVLGLEADFTKSGIERSQTVASDPPAKVKVTVDHLWSVRARAGLLVTPSLLLYGTAGFAAVQVSERASLGGIIVQYRGSGDGLVLGGGLEQAFGGRAFGRIEGLTDGDLVLVRTGLSYRF